MKIQLYHGFYLQYDHQEIVMDSRDHNGNGTDSWGAKRPLLWQ